jgi:glutathione synthase/RimK-type ligase-like ATP-grasp enzyme
VILIVTNRGDFTADWLVAELERRTAQFVRFNTEDYPTSTRLNWSASTSGVTASLTAAGAGSWSSVDVTAVWYRRPAVPQPSPDAQPARATWAVGEAAEALAGVWQTLPARWVNDPDRARAASLKPRQLPLAAKVGFRVPDTLVSNDSEAVRAFVDDHPAGVICKPIRDGHVPTHQGEGLFFTSLVTAEMVAFERFGAEPYLLQELIPKSADVRVTVIGGRVFGTRIHSQDHADARVDWRRVDPRQLHHEPVTLPPETATACVRLLEEFGLLFGAIDLAETNDGYVFFEVNPSGQWAWIEKLTGQPLRSALADLLVETGR